jgi:hypothetical protein
LYVVVGDGGAAAAGKASAAQQMGRHVLSPQRTEARPGDRRRRCSASDGDAVQQTVAA